jgi:hypothetical protein
LPYFLQYSWDYESMVFTRAFKPWDKRLDGWKGVPFPAIIGLSSQTRPLRRKISISPAVIFFSSIVRLGYSDAASGADN